VAKPSAFRALIAVLKKRWRIDYPFICPLKESRGTLPKASSFYVGVARPSGLHVFLHFQHSNKAWEVGQFTINVILTQDDNNPEHREPRGQWGTQLEGSHRIGFFLGRKDKWWHLRDDAPAIVTQEWRPTSYADLEVVLREAVDDVSRDVLAALRMLGIAGPQTVGDMLHGRVGRINSGGKECLSEDCGEKFTDYLEQKKAEGRL
jgi:hypothetical protein